MANSFVKAAGKHNADIKSFLREAASGNGLKYSAESGTKHTLFFPYKMVENIDTDGNKVPTKELINLSVGVHEWNGVDGKYRACICLQGVTLTDAENNVLNDGSCPICARIGNAWDIYRHRFEREQMTCGKVGEELTKHMEGAKSDLADERKAKDARDYIYILVAKFRMNQGQPVISKTTGLPEYDMKIMKLSTNRSEKIQKALENSGMEMAGAEIIIDYPDTTDVRHLSTDSVTTPVFSAQPNSILGKFPTLAESINSEAQAFTFEGIEKAFPEWKGMSTREAQITMDTLFKQYDQFLIEQQTNPNAQYMEYVRYEGGSTAPALTGPVAPVGAPAMPAPQQAAPVNQAAPVAPGAPPVNTNPAAPVVGEGGPIDVNAAFSNGVATL